MARASISTTGSVMVTMAAAKLGRRVSRGADDAMPCVPTRPASLPGAGGDAPAGRPAGPPGAGPGAHTGVLELPGAGAHQRPASPPAPSGR